MTIGKDQASVVCAHCGAAYRIVSAGGKRRLRRVTTTPASEAVSGQAARPGPLARFRTWFQARFHRVEVRPLPLAFATEVDGEGRQVVQAYTNIDGELCPVQDIQKLWRYGYREEAGGGRVVYVLSEEDRQTLQSIRSRAPALRDDGGASFPLSPTVLRYLREKHNVREGQQSGELRFAEQPLRPTARIDFDPEAGIEVETGYTGDAGEFVSIDQVAPTTDPAYVRIGDNTFAPAPRSLSQRARELLQQRWLHVPIDAVPEFFQRDLVLLKSEFSAVLTDLARDVSVIDRPHDPVVCVQKADRGWLDFHVEYSGKSLPPEVLAGKRDRKYHRLDATTWINAEARSLDEIRRKLVQLGAVETDGGFRVPVAQFASLEAFIADIGGRAQVDVAYRAFLEQLTAFKADPAFSLSDPLEAQLQAQALDLRPYQRAGVHWLYWLYTNYLHGLLADDMGLGKTLQSICVLRLAYEQSSSQQPSLVIAPKSVLVHWEREFHRCYPEIRTYRYHGGKRSPRALCVDRPVVFISTYDTVANDLEHFVQVPFLYLIVDEATRIKNPDARRTQAVKALNAAHRLALSGTPVENRPAELWSLFDFLMRGHLGRYGTFETAFEQPILEGDRGASEALGRRVRPFLLRRRKEEVAQDLPEKIEMKEWCGLSDEQRELYGGLQDEGRQIRSALQRGENVSYATSILPLLTKLKQICDHPAIVTARKQPVLARSEKFDRIIEHVEEILEAGEQVVVFSHFLGMLDLLEQVQRERQVPYIRIDGSTDNRQALIDRFNDGACPVALCSLQAAGHGINLTAGNHVIHADRWWNPAVEEQATDRVHRIGQVRTVYVYRILVEGTLEERIDQLLEEKRGMSDRIMDAATRGPHQWSREELIELLRPLDE